MKRGIALTAVVSAVALMAFAAFAGDEVEKGAMTLKGEIVDMGCYVSRGAHGADHASCAARCISGGMPMGLLTGDGKLYLLVMSHDDADPFNNAKKMAAAMVEITGPVSERDGFKAVEVSAIKELRAAGKDKPKSEG